MKCIYCGYNYIFGEYYVVRKAVKPKGMPYRWQDIGRCCEDCHDTHGKKVQYEFDEKAI